MLRFPFIQPGLEAYQRKFSVLDIGAGHAVVSRRAAREYDAVVVLVEKDFETTYPLPPEDVLCLKKQITPVEVREWGTCAHFDVGLAFNILHHFGKGWVDLVGGLLNLTDYLYVQHPRDSDVGACGQEVIPGINRWLEKEGTYLGEVPQFPQHPPRPIWLVKGNQEIPRLTRKVLGGEDGAVEIALLVSARQILADLAHKGTWKSWVPGMNLWNFLHLGGVKPGKDWLIRELKGFDLPETNHGDITPWNFILDGKRLHLIDGFEGWGGDDCGNLERAMQMVEEAYVS